jgi:hypothetical protein
MSKTAAIADHAAQVLRLQGAATDECQLMATPASGAL